MARKLARLALGRWRLLLSFCPQCNSDAPAVYSCPVCEGTAAPWPWRRSLKRSMWVAFKEHVG